MCLITIFSSIIFVTLVFPIVITLFDSYLSGRIQHVKYHPNISEPENICRGAPQGSVFLLHLNDLLRQLPISSYLAYADDETFVFSGSTLDRSREAMQQLLHRVLDWSRDKLLCINAKK